jgi:hypothetical protein
MHCYADLPGDDTEVDSTVDDVADSDAEWEAATSVGSSDSDTAAETAAETTDSTGTTSSDGTILADDGLIDNSLTMIVGIAGGIIVGVVGTIVFGVGTNSAWAIPVGIAAWLLSTAYLSRRRTVQAAVAHSGYAVALVILSFPLLALSPVVSVSGGLTGRLNTFAGFLVASIIMAAIPATVGWVASQFVSGD